MRYGHVTFKNLPYIVECVVQSQASLLCHGSRGTHANFGVEGYPISLVAYGDSDAQNCVAFL